MMLDLRKRCGFELMDFEIGLTILLCLLLSHWANQIGIHIEAIAVTTGAVMCVQEGKKEAYSACFVKMLGVVCGGVVGVIIVLIDNVLEMPYVFYLMCSVGVVVNLLICKMFKMIYVQARVSCISLLLVVMVLEGVDRLEYAINRFIGSLVGALIAFLITVLFTRLAPKSKD